MTYGAPFLLVHIATQRTRSDYLKGQASCYVLLGISWREGHWNSGTYRLPPCPTPLGPGTVVFREAGVLLQSSWGQSLIHQLSFCWL